MTHPGVLIVDSDAGERAKYGSVLSKARYTVHKAAGCAEALRILARHRGKLIVLSELDVNGDCGLQFLEGTLRKYPFLPFTFFTSAPKLESVIEALKKGAYDFLRKPVSPEILRHSVARSVQKMELTLETEQQHREIRKLYLLNRADLKKTRDSSSFKGFMISMAAHDFRSILTVLDGYLQLIRERCDVCPVTGPSGILLHASRSIARMRTMASTLLDYEAAESGTIRLDIRPFPLSGALRDCVDFYRPYAEQKKVRLSIEEETPEEIVVDGDQGKLMEVLDNLVYNALKFTPSRGSILLSGKKEDGMASVRVSDSGAGIPREKLRKILGPETMVVTLDAHARLGLGLAICKKLIEAQKGEIRVESALGKGTKVYLSLPVAKCCVS